MRKHNSQVAIITGGADGLGLATALKMAFGGAAVVVADQNLAMLDAAGAEVELAGALSCHACRCDPSVEEQVQRVIDETLQRFGSLDIVINAAHMEAFPYADHLASESWQKTVSMNLAGAFYFTKHALPKMSYGGTIINVFSSYQIPSVPAISAYSAAMAAMLSLTRITAAKARSLGIRINAVLPCPSFYPIRRDRLKWLCVAPNIDHANAVDWDATAAAIAFLALRNADDWQGAAFKVHGCCLDRV